eukprot:403374012
MRLRYFQVDLKILVSCVKNIRFKIRTTKLLIVQCSIIVNGQLLSRIKGSLKF